MVPGSTLRYGSSLMRVTLRPRDSRIAAREAAAMPLPSEDTTPPVTKTNLVMSVGLCVEGRGAPVGGGRAHGRNAMVVKRDYTGGRAMSPRRARPARHSARGRGIHPG